MGENDYEVIVVGAGLSGIGAGYHLKHDCPGTRFVILEGRDAIGGTWDLFRYPGVRSDSDMFTLGYPFHPWKEANAIADGPSILAYLRDTARTYGIEDHVRFGRKVVAASWSSEDAAWTLEVRTAAGVERYRTRFLYLCSGYYAYDEAHDPDLPGRARFGGRIVHPQWWPEDLDYAGKRVVVVGSGATAVTLVPALAKQAAHVTMLQRSPTWIASLPAEDRLAKGIRAVLPERAAHRTVRWKNALLNLGFYQFCRRFPRAARRVLLKRVRALLPLDVPVDPHFTPRYDPWDQRLCLVPDGDLFAALASGRASVVTGEIDTFTETGIRLASGDELAADVIVTATGLKLLPVGGIRLEVDGRPVDPAETLVYKGLMLGGVPNLAWSVGYTNASWTLRSDLSSRFVCRLLNHMDRHGQVRAVPRPEAAGEGRAPLLDLNAGYVRRAADRLPKQGTKAPWRLRQNYVLDYVATVFGRVDDGTLELSGPAGGASPGRRSA